MPEISHELALLDDHADLESKEKATAEKKREEAASDRADVCSRVVARVHSLQNSRG